MFVSLFNSRKNYKYFHYLTFLVCIPYTIIWAFFFSYDVRNLVFIFPILALCAGGAMVNLFTFIRNHGSDFFNKIKNIKLFYFVILLIIGLAALNHIYSNEYLISKQIIAQKSIGSPVLNRALYSYNENNKINGKILTDYRFLNYLPELNEYFLGYNFKKIYDDKYIDSFFSEIKNPDINFILCPLGETDQKISDYIQERIDNGTYEVLFEIETYSFIHIIESE